MKTKKSFGRCSVLVLAALLAVAFGAYSQQRTGGGGGGGGGGFGGGGFGGGGGGGARSSSSSSTGLGSRDYPNSTLPGDATFSIDPVTRTVLVMSDDSTFSHITQVVSNLDRPVPQVLIKVVFLEVQHQNALDVGIEGSYGHSFGNPMASNVFSVGNNFGLAGLGSTGQTIGSAVMPAGAGLYSVLGNDFQATLRLIASAEKTEVLSRPSIMVRNNQPATITVGQSVPLVTGVTYPSALAGPVSTISYQNVGIILQVTPFISPDGLVEMIVSPQISSLSSQQVQIATNQFAPVIDLRSASTVVVTPDGQTIIIGGLMQNEKTVIDSKIPLLGDIPLLGNLFKHKQNSTTKSELMIFLTPHIVTMPSQVASVTSTERGKSELMPQSFTDQDLDRFFDNLEKKSAKKPGNKPVPSGN
jgi:general secretion pathway protein D